jgi:hypothetical protein
LQFGKQRAAAHDADQATDSHARRIRRRLWREIAAGRPPSDWTPENPEPFRESREGERPMPRETLFEGFERFGDRFLARADATSPVDTEFRALLGRINALLLRTHGMIVAELEKIERSDGTASAKAALARLGAGSLAGVFHLQGLCDEFGVLGDSLRTLLDRSALQGAAAASDPDVEGVLRFAEKLALRETEMADLYGAEIADLIGSDLAGDDLSDLKLRAARVRKLLTDQMADFSSKAARFGRSA